MSQEAIINLVKLAKKDEALLAELRAAQTYEEKAAVAVKHGCDVKADELVALRALADEGKAGGELSDEELEMVSGGSFFSRLKAAATWVKDHVFVDTSNKTAGVKGKF